MFTINMRLVIMNRYTAQQRAFAVKAFYLNSSSFVVAQRVFSAHFGINRNHPVPSAHAIKLWVNNFEQSGTTIKKIGGRKLNIRTQENIERVREAIGRSPRRSACRHSATLRLSNRTVRRILHDDFHHHPYKIQVVQALNENDYVSRRLFCEQFLALINENEDIVHNLWMSDEAHFHLSGYVNKQNFRYWSDTNPRQLHQRPLHSSKVTVWCALSSSGIIGPYFFENERGEAVTVNSERYSQMLQNFFIPQIAQYGVTGFFQQDGATSHTARVSMNILKDLFPNLIISRNGNIP